MCPQQSTAAASPSAKSLTQIAHVALMQVQEWRVLLIDEKLRAATTHKISLWTLAASLDSPHRYLEGCKNVQATLGTTAALIVSITLGSLLDEPISGGGVNVVVLQVYLCLMVTSSLAMLMCVLTATVMYTQLELVGVMSDVDDVLDAILFNIPGLDEHISTAQNFFTYGSWCALVGWWLKLVMLYGWRSPAAALYACFCAAVALLFHVFVKSQSQSAEAVTVRIYGEPSTAAGTTVRGTMLGGHPQLLRDGNVRFAGYRMPHPLENVMELKVQTSGGDQGAANV